MPGQYARDQPQGFSNYIQKVAIVGPFRLTRSVPQAGGLIGRHLTEHLVKAGKHDVTAISRPNSIKQLPDVVRVVRVDYSGDDTSALVEALRGQHALIITMAVSAPRDTMTKLTHAATEAGVPYILPNWFGHDAANDPLCQDSLLTEMRDTVRSEIQHLGVSAPLFLVCNFWYEFSLGGGPDCFGFDFPTRSLTLFDKGTIAINTTTWPQCGRAALQRGQG
ncbi:uncharacterized protein B0T15DRAFT_402339 [Chaetomium strumarium]|uniref:NAD(P)-binding domain-containing protein n=1 Tax=Chaetomium strumarium TaxID=1170767 RepID=A0AAJ0LZ16_9PEZI|nr:hypothetical protein B0T15DRAFT_402339 [Chaetomium strumarium]